MHLYIYIYNGRQGRGRPAVRPALFSFLLLFVFFILFYSFCFIIIMGDRAAAGRPAGRQAFASGAAKSWHYVLHIFILFIVIYTNINCIYIVYIVYIYCYIFNVAFIVIMRPRSPGIIYCFLV